MDSATADRQNLSDIPSYPLTSYMESSQPFVLNSWLLDRVSQLVFRTKQPSIFLSFVSAMIVATIIYGITTSAQILIEPEPFEISIIFLILSAVGGGVTLFAVKVAHVLGFSRIARSLEPIIQNYDDTKALLNWLKSIFRPSIQIIVSLIWGLVGVTLAFQFFPSSVLDGHSPVVFAIIAFITQFLTGQGFYWGIIFPMLWRRVGETEVKLNWLNPRVTPEFRNFASIANLYTFILSSVATLYLVWLLVIMKPFKARTAALTSISLTTAILILVLYAFIEPHRHLAKAIKRQKDQTVRDIEKLIITLRSQMTVPSKDDIEKLHQLRDLQQTVATSPSSLINFGDIRSLISSLLLPILPYLFSMVDLSSLFHLTGQ